jgi:hypothetical protein
MPRARLRNDRLELSEVLIEDGEGEIDSTREVPVEHALSDPGLTRDRSERDVVAALGEEAAGCPEQRPPVGGRRGRAPVAGARRCRHPGSIFIRIVMSG